MIYLREFTYPDPVCEEKFLHGIRQTCFQSFYPFGVLSDRNPGTLELEPITLFYGGNGSGKTTALNIIAETLHIKRSTLYNRSSFFQDYCNFCRYTLTGGELPDGSLVITSDDVFDYLLDIRALNEGIHQKRSELFSEYTETKYASFQMQTLDDYEELKKRNHIKAISQSAFTREHLMQNVREHSNGENAFHYFLDKIGEDTLILLDEPENSLSVERQLELADVIENAARFDNCQFIIATHSPFLLSLKGARVYNWDRHPVKTQKWTELPNMRLYYEFFQKYADLFSETENL